MTGGDGYLLDNRQAEAGERFDALSVIFDPSTFRHIDDLGIGPGWRCWEVGAGGPSVPGWLASRAGPAGRVLATDIDVSWAAGAESDAVVPQEVERVIQGVAEQMAAEQPKPAKKAVPRKPEPAARDDDGQPGRHGFHDGER